MSRNKRNVTKWRLQSSYITTNISLALVLFLLGMLGLLILNAKKLSDFAKENINFTIVVKADAKEADIFKVQKELDALRYIKSTEYITRERAAKEFSNELGEDFVNFLGYNPLLSSIEVKLHAQFANAETIQKIETLLKSNSLIQEVIYEKSLVHLVNDNVKKISLIVFGFSGIMFLIALALINNTVRLLVYSRRFLIRTMQLVGATRGFIRKPFLYKSLLHGILSAFFAIGLMLTIIYFTRNELQGIDLMVDIQLLAYLCSGIVCLGITINFLSTFFAINKYLNIETENLYQI